MEIKRVGYAVEHGLLTHPVVRAFYDVVDPATGPRLAVPLTFTDDEAREIVPMISKKGVSIVDVDAALDLEKLDELAAARFDEASRAASTVTERMQQAEAARSELRDATEGLRVTLEQTEAANAELAKLKAEIAALKK